MRFFNKNKRKPNRRVFGFLCDDDLADRVRRLAEIYEVRIYCFAEHLLQLGLAHMAVEIRNNPEKFTQVMEEHQDHLVNYHFLVDRLGEEQYERDLIARHAELTTEQIEQVEAVIALVKKFSDDGTPHPIVMAVIEKMVAREYKRRKQVENRR